ncbi:MAG: hypothetical protein JO047_07330, partial [Alphaproteobacteria bacterium]|nr:hypothetical protein [Alphaproteobacteria bacterium]
MHMQSAGRRGSASGAVLLALAALVTGALAIARPMPAAAAGDDLYQPAAAEPGTDIPQTGIRFGMRPYADNTFYIIAMKKGWFKDV